MAIVDIIELIKPETGEKFYPSTTLSAVRGNDTLPRFGSVVQSTLPLAISQLVDSSNTQFYPQTHAEAVIGLSQMIEDNQFFVKVQDSQDPTKFSIKLKDEYDGLWANGWIADGGIGSGGGGGGGGSSTLYGLNDVSIPQPPSAPSANDILSYSTSLGKWTNVAKATFLSGYAEQSWVQSWVQQQGYLLPSALNPYVLSSSLATVATTGNYSDLNGLPTLPSAPGTLVTNNSAAQATSASESLSGTINLHKVSKTGNYNDLLNLPTIPAAQIQSDWNQTNASSKDYIKNKPSLSAVATSGSYNDLSNKPSIPNEATVSGWGFTKNAGTVTSVALTLPTGLSVSGSPITSSGTLSVSFANGYSIPLTADTTKGVTAYGWGDHSQAGYVTLTGAQTISGLKTFSADITLSGVDLVPAADDTCSLGTTGSGGKRIHAAFVRNIYTSYFEFRNDAGTTKTGGIGFDGNLASIVVTNSGTDYPYKFYAPNNDGNGFFFNPPTGQTQHVPLGKSDHRWTKIWGEEGDYSGALTLSGASDTTRRIYFGGSTYFIELKDLGSGQNPRYAFRFNAPIYSDFWIADGGIGSGSGGGGGSSTLYGLNDVSIPQPPSTPSTNDVLSYNGTKWTNVSKATFLSGYATTSALAGKQDLIDANHKLSYNLLTDTPTIPAAQVQSDWNATTGMGVILNKPSIPTESTVSGWGFTKNTGTVTSVAMSVPEGLSVSGSPITTNGTLAVSFANGYSIPTTAKQGNWDTAYSTVTGSQTKNKVFASPSNASGAPSFRSLVAADIPSLNASKITEGTLDSARLPSMYIGKTAVKFNNTNNDTLVGINGFTTASSPSASGDTSLVVWEPNGGGTGVGVWHFKGNIVVDGWIADGGIGSGSSGGAGTLYDLSDVNIPKPTSYPGNNDILTYDLSTHKWVNTGKATFLSGYATTSDLAGKQDVISDLATIRTGAALGATALQSYTETDPTVPSWAKQSSKPSYTFSEIGSKPTTISGYGITDAKIANGEITLGSNTITPVQTTGNQSISGNKTFTGTIYASSIMEQSSSSPLLIGNPQNETYIRIVEDTSIYNVNLLGMQVVSGDPSVKWIIEKDGAATFTSLSVGGDSVTPSNYVTLTGQQDITGAKTFKTSDITMQGISLLPSANNTCYLGSITANANKRFAGIYGVNADFSGNLAVGGDISSVGDIYFSANNKAIFGKDLNGNNVQLIKLYQDTNNVDGLYFGSDAVGRLQFNAIGAAQIVWGTGYRYATFDGDNAYLPSIRPNGASGAALGANWERWSKLWSVDADLTGNLALAQTSQITLGPVTITYDATNKALHISGTDNGQTIGIYCDGWIADGGIQQTS